jgi:hypothetical protein
MKRALFVLALASAALLLSACDDAPPSMRKLLAAKISEQYPDYEVTNKGTGALLVERRGMAPVEIDVDAIAQFCQRGKQDCDYATDKMLLDLQPK